jgi:hypothetical protein
MKKSFQLIDLERSLEVSEDIIQGRRKYAVNSLINTFLIEMTQ